MMEGKCLETECCAFFASCLHHDRVATQSGENDHPVCVARMRRGGGGEEKGEEDSERRRRRDVNLVIQSDLFDNVVYGTAAAAEREMEWMSELAHTSEWVGVEITAILSEQGRSSLGMEAPTLEHSVYFEKVFTPRSITR